ncbi:uncharacterized protein LOC135105203 [Scylla paramamosain]|uniref:uncharacterized protein LOC135105203 n=1 Tax=Scylla paramamosain TaxID=85552 RepID=UPI003082B201
MSDKLQDAGTSEIFSQQQQNCGLCLGVRRLLPHTRLTQLDAAVPCITVYTTNWSLPEPFYFKSVPAVETALLLPPPASSRSTCHGAEVHAPSDEYKASEAEALLVHCHLDRVRSSSVAMKAVIFLLVLGLVVTCVKPDPGPVPDAAATPSYFSYGYSPFYGHRYIPIYKYKYFIPYYSHGYDYGSNYGYKFKHGHSYYGYPYYGLY